MNQRLLTCLLALTAGCDTTGAPIVELLDGEPPAAPDAGSPTLDIRGVPDNPEIEATFDALGDPPGEWVDPPECPISTDDAHCELCWGHTDTQAASFTAQSLDRNDAGDLFGAALALGDFNGDGYPDLAVGAPEEDHSSTSGAGLVYVYLGSSRGFQPWLALDDGDNSGPYTDGRFGASLATIDLDSTDDHDDLVVGYGGDVSGPAILVFEGQTDGFGMAATVFTLVDLDPDDSTDTDTELGAAIVAGDLDGDGDEDLAVGAPNYDNGAGSSPRGAVFRLENTSGALSDNGRIDGEGDGDRFGAALAYMPSTDDLYVGAPGRPRVYPYDGTTKGTDYVGSISEFGTSLFIADITTDGTYEVVVGGTGSGTFEICDGTTCDGTTISGTFDEVRPLAAGDLDEDGEPDLVVAAVPSSGEQELHFFQGDGTTQPDVWFELTAGWTGRPTGDLLGSAGRIWDIDGDDHLDLLVGGPGPASGAGGGDVNVFVPSAPMDWAASIEPSQIVDQETGLDTCDECAVYGRSDGDTLCGDDDEDQICVFGECVNRDCGDGYRQTGDEVGVSWVRESCDDGNGFSGDACDASCDTALLELSSRTDAIESPSRLPPAIAEDGNNDLLFVFGSDHLAEFDCPAYPFIERPRNRLAAWRTNYGGVIYPLYAPGMEPLCPQPFIELAAFPGSGWDAEATAAGLPDGGWVVAWTSPTEDAAGTGVAMRIVHSDGTLGPTLVANQTEIGEQYEPRVAALTDGFIVVWTDASGVDGPFGRTLIKARRFTNAGAPIEDEWVVSDPDNTSSQPALAAIGDLFLVLYAEHSDDPFDGSTLLAYREGPGGTTSGMKVSELNWAAEPTLAALDSSTFIAAWTARSSSDRLGQIEARTVPTTGDMVGTVNTFGVADETDSAPSVAPLSGDGYIVAWEADGRRRGLAYGYVSMSGVPEFEAEDLDELIVGGLQGDVTLLTTFRGTWFAWSDAHRSIGSGDALRSFVAFLLPGS